MSCTRQTHGLRKRGNGTQGNLDNSLSNVFQVKSNLYQFLMETFSVLLHAIVINECRTNAGQTPLEIRVSLVSVAQETAEEEYLFRQSRLGLKSSTSQIGPL